MKQCSKCKEIKPFSEYSPDKRALDGLQSQCNPCRRIVNRLYQKARREREREREIRRQQRALLPPKKCAIDGCNGKMHGNVWCIKHYKRVLIYGNPSHGDKTRHEKCIIDGCNKNTRSGYSQYCETHYYRMRRNGTIELRPISKRHMTDNGYVKIKEKHVLSDKHGWISEHRIVLFNKIGPGIHLCHWCGKEVDFDLSYPKHLNGLVSDHIDGNKEHNDPDNLVPSCALCNMKRTKSMS